MADADNNQNEKIENDGGYEVGYGKPPKASRFQKGQVGNPKGRPPGAKNFKTNVRNALNSRVRMKLDGKSKNVSSQEAVLLTLMEQALGKRNMPAIKTALELGRLYNDDEIATEVSALSEGDNALLNAYVERHASESLEEDENEEDDGCEE